MKTLQKHTGTPGFKMIGDAGTFEGYASTFGVLDLGGDIVIKGAYARTLGDRGTKGIKMLWAHDSGCPIGVWDELKEDDTGLFARGRLLLSIPKGQEVYTLMREGIVDGLSIGYQVVNSARDAANGARLLQEVDLREISVVTFPMNETSLISSVKGGMPTEREFERWLTQDAGFSRSQARQIITDGFKALKTTKPGAGEEGTAEDFDWGHIAAGLEDLTSLIRK